MSKLNTNREQRRMARIGLPDFETPRHCETRQRELIDELQRHRSSDELIEGLANCSRDICGLVECRSGCHFGSRRLRCLYVSKIHDHLRNAPDPLFAVTIVHPDWSWQYDDAFDPDRIVKAMDWLTDRLKSSQCWPLVSFGGWEFNLNISLDGKKTWCGHIHIVVFGAQRADLEKCLKIETDTPRQPYERTLMIQNIGSLGRQIGYTCKPFAEKRVAYRDDQGRTNQRHLPLSGKDLYYFDKALLSIPVVSRIFCLCSAGYYPF